MNVSWTNKDPEVELYWLDYEYCLPKGFWTHKEWTWLSFERIRLANEIKEYNEYLKLCNKYKDENE